MPDAASHTGSLYSAQRKVAAGREREMAEKQAFIARGWVLGAQGHEGLVDRVVDVYRATKFQHIGRDQGYKAAGDWWKVELDLK